MKRGTPDHPKMLMLANELSISIFSAVGLLEILWHFTARYCPAGDIGRWGNDAIARAVGWPHGDADRLIEALIVCRWLDVDEVSRLAVHDWPEHCEDTTHLVLARKVRRFANGKIPNLRRLARAEREEIEAAYGVQSQDESALCAQNAHRERTESALPKPKPEPEPEPEPVPKPKPPNSINVEFPDSLQTAAFKKAWESWESYRKEIRKSLTPSTSEQQLGLLAGWGEPKAIEAITKSITQGWVGLFDPDDRRRGSDRKSSEHLRAGNYTENDDFYETPFEPQGDETHD